jgi:hypothetical protein
MAGCRIKAFASHAQAFRAEAFFPRLARITQFPQRQRG